MSDCSHSIIGDPDSDRGSECSKGSSAVKQVQDDICHTADSAKNGDTGELVGEHPSASELDHLEQGSVKPCSSDSDGQVDGEGAQDERQVSPDKLYRAAILKNRFLDTILKAREKTLSQDEKMDPEKLADRFAGKIKKFPRNRYGGLTD